MPSVSKNASEVSVLPEETIQDFAEQLGLEISNPDYFQAALTHPTFAHESKSYLAHYERLEFLGDAVLELMVSEYLFKVESNATEGRLTKLRAAMVREESLADLANRHNLGSYLRLGHGEAGSGGSCRESNLANCYEAVLAAIYLDRGLAYLVDWFHEDVEWLFSRAKAGLLVKDYKSQLLEYFQARHERDKIAFQIEQIAGPAHAPSFLARIFHSDELLAEAVSNSKKKAEQLAASIALEKFG